MVVVYDRRGRDFRGADAKIHTDRGRYAEQRDGHDAEGPANQRGRSGYRRPPLYEDPAPVIKCRVRHVVILLA